MPTETPLPPAPATPLELTPRQHGPDAPAAAEPRRCANCGGAAEDAFCPRCGQEQHDYHRSVRSIFGEALDAFAGWDAKIPASIWLLLARPGRLTTEFLGGRRARYLRPLRLYLLLSVAFFVTLRYEAARSKGHVNLNNVSITDESAPIVAAGAGRDHQSALSAAAEGLREGMRARERGGSAIDSTQLGEFLKRRPSSRERGVGAWFKYTFKGRLLEISRLPAEQRDRMVRDAFLSKLGNVAICLVPVFALLLRVLWFRARLYYAEHFVVALHTHAFAFGALTLIMLLAEGGRAVARLPAGPLHAGLRAPIAASIVVLAVWLPVYPFMAFRRVYGGSRTVTLARYVVLGTLYSVALMLGATVAIFAAILFG